MICKFCNKYCKNDNSLRNHERLCKSNPNRQLTSYEKYGPIPGFNLAGRVAWNKNLTKDKDERIRRRSETYSKNHKLGKHKFRSHKYTEEQKLAKSLRMRAVYANKSPDSHICGRSKKGWYKDYWCGSSWELAFVIYCLDNNIKIQRNTTGFKYYYQNEEHTYYPDFYLTDADLYIEIKGYYDNKAKSKSQQFPKSLLVMQRDQMRSILDYVEKKYGKNFIDLYEK